MADQFFSVNKGGMPDSSFVTTGAATSGQSVELRVHTGDGHTKMSVLLALETLKNHITRAAAITP